MVKWITRLFGLAALIAAAACAGDEDDGSAVSAELSVDGEAEAPYARASQNPPSHATSATFADEVDQRVDNSDKAIEAAADIDNSFKKPATKVSNFTNPKPLNDDAGLKSAASGGTALDANPFRKADLVPLKGNAAAGEVAFAVCAECHSTAAGEHRIGPSLYGVIGRNAGQVDGFDYSAIYGNLDLVWDEDTLFGYLDAPQDYVPGSKMGFDGVRDATSRADLVAYLKTLR